MRKKNSRQRLFQTCDTLSSSASAVNAYGRLKIQYLCWRTVTSGLPTKPPAIQSRLTRRLWCISHRDLRVAFRCWPAIGRLSVEWRTTLRGIVNVLHCAQVQGFRATAGFLSTSLPGKPGKARTDSHGILLLFLASRPGELVTRSDRMSLRSYGFDEVVLGSFVCGGFVLFAAGAFLVEGLLTLLACSSCFWSFLPGAVLA